MCVCVCVCACVCVCVCMCACVCVCVCTLFYKCSAVIVSFKDSLWMFSSGSEEMLEWIDSQKETLREDVSARGERHYWIDEGKSTRAMMEEETERV